jgi:predicted ABC-type ATPase
MDSISKKIIIIAGPNGAGKTTFARAFLPAEAHCNRFINADLMLQGYHHLHLNQPLLEQVD